MRSATWGLPVPEPSVDEINERADEILSRAEFQPPEQSWLQRVGQWIEESLGRVLADVLGAGAGSLVTWIVLGVGVAVVLVVLVRVLRTTQRDPGVAVLEPEHRTRSAAEWRAEADRLEAEGRWRAALRARYRAMVTDLVERRVLADVPGRTVGEYRAEVRRHAPGIAPDFDDASELFEQAWYGNASTGADESHRVRDLARQVESRP